MNVDLQAPAGSTSDDIAAAIQSIETGAPAPSGTSDIAPTSGAPGRGADGRFQAAPGASPAPPGAVAAPTAPTIPAPTPGSQPGAATAPPVAAPPGLGAPPALDPSRPPQGWRPEAKQKWGTIPEDIRQEIIRREEASANGVAQLQQEYEALDELDEILDPFSGYVEHIGVDPAEYLTNLIRTEQTLTLGNPAQKMQTLLDLADTYGIPLRQVIDSAMQGQLDAVMRQSHSYHKTPATVPPQVQMELNQLRAAQQQMVNAAADAELNNFLQNEAQYPFFSEVSEDMADLIEAGVVDDYQEAYELAVWRNPEARQRAIAMANGQQQAAGVTARQGLAASISTPSSASIAGSLPNVENESTEDTIRRAWTQHSTNGV